MSFRSLTLASACLGALLLAGCGEQPKAPTTAQAGPDRLTLTPASFRDLSGWSDDRMAEVLPAIKRSCDKLLKLPPDRAVGNDGLAGTAGDWTGPCGALQRLGDKDHAAVRQAMETWFEPFKAANQGRTEGLFTGYYEAELKASRRQGGRYTTPILGRPADLVTADLGAFNADLKGQEIAGRLKGTKLEPYPSRAEIEGGAIRGLAPELLWTDDPVDLHILHIQGSGRVTLDDGTTTRIGYAGTNGQKFVGLGRILLDRGAIKPGEDSSMQAIRAWLKANPREAAGLMAQNPRYVFFRPIDGDGPVGAQGVALTPGRSLAVDPKFIPYGLPIWLDTTEPGGPGQPSKPLRRLMVAQDTGTAIRGPVRADFFWGTGETALDKAGRMKQKGEYYLLLPRQRSNRLAQAQ